MGPTDENMRGLGTWGQWTELWCRAYPCPAGHFEATNKLKRKILKIRNWWDSID